ncbi:MAG: ArsR/SmtB family transcription factor [Haloarculaceae archaeon]
MAEFETDVALEDVVVRDARVSSAVDEPLRAMLLDMLADEELTIAQLHAALADRGYERTENTVRHHVNELRDAGLVAVARLEERRGGTTKFYRANTIVLSYALPDDSDEAVAELVDAVRPEVAAALDTLEGEYGDVIEEITAGMAPCEHCRTQKYETFLLLTVLRRALVAETRDG